MVEPIDSLEIAVDDSNSLSSLNRSHCDIK
ncbi:hypothetical protein P3T21_002336 [Paraburkholderia sp. GAS334]